MTAPAFATSQGTTFSWKSTSFHCVDISYDASAPSRERVDMSTLDLADGAEMVMRLAPLKPKRDPKKFSITYKSTGETITEGDEGTLTTADGSGTYRCTSATKARKVGAFIEGSATFEELISDEYTSGA